MDRVKTVVRRVSIDVPVRLFRHSGYLLMLTVSVMLWLGLLASGNAMLVYVQSAIKSTVLNPDATQAAQSLLNLTG